MPIRAVSCGFAVLPLVVGVALLLGPAEARGAGSWVWPVEGEVITGYRNGGDPYAAGQHRGIDIAATPGTPVVAAAAGIVRFRGVAGSNGLTVTIRTADGRYDTSYLHLSAAGVREGQELGAGERIGAVGTGGRRSAQAPHLHFGVRLAGTRHDYVDPLGLLAPPGAPRPAEPPRAPVPVVRRSPWRPLRRRWRSFPVRVPAARRVPLGRRVRVPAGAARAGARTAAGAGGPARALGRACGSRCPRAGRRSVAGTWERGLWRSSSRARSRPASRRWGRTPPRPVPRSRDRRRGEAMPARAPARAEPARAGGGPDVGWAIACVGLLLAAACLGRPGAGGGERRSGASSVKSWLKPLVGGR